VEPKFLGESFQRSFTQDQNNRHTGTNTIQLAEDKPQLPDRFVQVKNYKNLQGMARMTE